MIFVTLGTQDKSFDRLLKAIDREIENGNIKDEVIVQAGYTKYKSKNMKIFDLISSDEFDELIKKCDILITHGGVGSILTGLKNNKKVIAAARLSKYKEHTNDHQKEIVEEFSKRGYIIELSDFKKLNEVLKRIKTFKPKKYKSNNDKFVKIVEDYIEKEKHISWFNKYRKLISYGFRGIILTLINVLIFNILINKFDLYMDILISFGATYLFEIVSYLIFNIRIKGVKYIITKLLLIGLDLLSMYLLVNIIKYDLFISKVITNFVIIVLTCIFVKLISKKDV